MAKSSYKLPPIALIACGGTIGGEWSPVHDTVISSKTGNQKIKEYIQFQARPHRSIHFIDAFNKDSRSVTRVDLVKIYKIIKRMRQKNIRHFIITHGTFTMIDTAKYLDRRFRSDGIWDTFVVMCGSFIPVTGFAPSDAQFNVGFALGKLSMLQDSDQVGSWICMNGLFTRPSAIVKNVKKARFEMKDK